MESVNEKGPRNATPTKIGRSEFNHERSESAKKPPRSSTLEINTPITERNNVNGKT